MRHAIACLGLLITLLCAPAFARYELVTVAEPLAFPWGIAFLPGGELLVTERTGTLRRIGADGSIGAPLAGVPEVFVRGQGGLLDVALDPAFATNGLVYLSYAHGDAGANATRIARGRLTEAGLENLEVIFTIEPSKDTPQHYGGSLAFMNDGTLLVTTGDGFVYREAAQDRASMLGKTLRINADGSLPADNPFADDPATAAVWTFGHRNPQGLAVDPQTGAVYQHEHGPRGGDELNRLLPGRNYGWPAVTFGLDYTGAHVSPYTELPDMEPPLKYWVPSIAPSGLAIYQGEAFPDWRGSLFVGALVDREVRRLTLADGTVVGEERLFGELGERIRNVRVGPDGNLYLLTDSEQGKVVRVAPRAAAAQSIESSNSPISSGVTRGP
jgi:aldose sugar dehydrogenase